MAIGVTWVSAFLDLAPAAFDAGTRHWAAVTGYDVSPARGDTGEFTTLVPPDGDAYLRVQRLGTGASRIHLDVHVGAHVGAVDDAAGVAQRLGGRVVGRSRHGYVVLASPAGIVHCLVAHPASRRPAPARWGGADGHRSVVDQVALDLAADDADREVDYWQGLTGWEHRVSTPPYSALVRPTGQPLRIMFHRVGDDRSPATVHLDLATDDRPAEVARHLALGSQVRTVASYFTLLVDPTGSPYCVTDRDPDTGLLG